MCAAHAPDRAVILTPALLQVPQQLGRWASAVDLTRLTSGWFQAMSLEAVQCFLVWRINNNLVLDPAQAAGQPTLAAVGRAAMRQLQDAGVQQHLFGIMSDIAKRLSDLAQADPDSRPNGVSVSRTVSSLLDLTSTLMMVSQTMLDLQQDGGMGIASVTAAAAAPGADLALAVLGRMEELCFAKLGRWHPLDAAMRHVYNLPRALHSLQGAACL